jgi:hypothetical protein
MDEQQKFERADLRSIATYQKGIIFCILFNLIAFACQFVLPDALRIFLFVGFGGLSIVATVFVFLLATKVYSTGTGIVYAILTFIPLIGLVMLLLINGKATKILKSHGIRVGLLGATMSDLN